MPVDHVSFAAVARSWVPPALLAVYAVLFAWRALGGGLLVVDDHPGQLYRLAHVLALGPWPWRLNPGWWAGYAELQYYPPGAAYAGALLHVASLGARGAERAYQLLLWGIFVLPGVATYWLLARVLGSSWLALPGAFVALTLSAGSRSGVEEGLRWGLIAARLGWGLLPLLMISLRRWTSRESSPMGAAFIVAAIVLIHPAHAPAALVLVGLAACQGPGSRTMRSAGAARLVACAAGLSAFWIVPLVAHLEMALPLAWGDASVAALAWQVGARPLLLALVAGAVAACWTTRSGADARDRWLALFAPALAVVVLVDALAAPFSGVMWLPADRLMDSLLLALVVGASLGLRALGRRLPRFPDWGLAVTALVAAVLLAAPGRGEATLTVWPRRGPGEWTTESTLVSGARLDALWALLERAPPGRTLFLRSGVPLVYRPEWWRPHSHVTALTPLRTGREIVNGTFTHPSPIAGLVYTGSAANRPITELVEERDGRTLFGQPVEALDAPSFARLAALLGISAVVALDEDEGRLDFLTAGAAFGRPRRIGPFLVFFAREPRPLPTRVAPQRWRVPADGADAFVRTAFAYSPLWQAHADGTRLEVRRDDLGLLEVHRPPGGRADVELTHSPGAIEWAGLSITILTALGLAVGSRR